MQIIYTANEEVARGLYNPAYKLLQMLPGPRNKGQVCMQRFHLIMQELLQEVSQMIVSSLPVKHNHCGYVLPLDWSPMLNAALYSCCKMSVRF